MSESRPTTTGQSPTDVKPTKQRLRLDSTSFAICIFLVVVTAVVYARVAGYPFIDLDDGPYVFHNSHVQQSLTPKSFHWALTTFRAANWHPLTWISHIIDCSVYGVTHPGGHHVTSLLLHIANTLLLFLLLSRMTGSKWRGGFVAALFALHPMHVESVAWIAERKDVLSTFFLLLTMLAYVSYSHRPGARRYIPVVLLYALGLMAKPMLVSLPLILLMLDWWPLKRFESLHLKALILEKLPLFALAAASCAVTYLAQFRGGAAQTLEEYPIGVRAANALVAYAAYVLKLLWPANLTVQHSHPGSTLPIWQVIASGAALAAATYLAVRLRKKLPYVFVGWLWYVVTLIPVIGLLQVGLQATSDRYTYVPYVGLFIIAAWGIPAAAAKLGASRKALALLAVAVIAALAICTWVQVGYWRNTTTLARHCVQATGGDSASVIFLAGCYGQAGQTDRAIDLLTHALKNRQGVAQVQVVLGNALYAKGKTSEAENHYGEAIRIQPDLAMAPYHLGDLLLKQGKTAAAEQEFRAAIEIDHRYPDPHFELGMLYAGQGRLEDALKEFDEAARLDSRRTDAQANAATVLCRLGRPEEAIPRLEAAIDEDPNQSGVHLLLGQVLLQQGASGQLDQAVVHLEHSTKLAPKWGLAHCMLAIGLNTKGDYAGAWREVKLARRYGSPPPPAFIDALSKSMPEPQR